MDYSLSYGHHGLRPLSSIRILYNQALVGGLSDSFDPDTRIPNIQLNGGSSV